jgi:tetratricopeptide (TPR) repeat protein
MVEIGKELGVNYLVEGSAQTHADSVRIIAQLIDAKTDKHVWSDNFDFELKQVFQVQSNISAKIAKELKTVISPDAINQINKNSTKNFEAYNLYLKGRFFWHRRTEADLKNSIHYFEQAIALDSTYSMAYSGLADSYFVMPWYMKEKDWDTMFRIAKEYTEKALSLDTNNAEAHATLGGLLCFKDWNWEASEKELKLAIKLNPNYATAHQYYAELLEILGRAKEARREIDLALQLNPNSYIMTMISARLYMNEGLFEKAITEAKIAKELNMFKKRGTIMSCYTYLGKDDEAFKEWEEWQKTNPNPNIELNKGLREAFENSGIKGFWKYYAQYLLKTGIIDADKSPVLIAHNLAYLGETEKALELLELACEQRHLRINRIKYAYDFKNLRNEPRFLAILNKLNLGDYE